MIEKGSLLMRGLTVIIVCFLLFSRQKDDRERINF